MTYFTISTHERTTCRFSKFSYRSSHGQLKFLSTQRTGYRSTLSYLINVTITMSVKKTNRPPAGVTASWHPVIQLARKPTYARLLRKISESTIFSMTFQGIRIHPDDEKLTSSFSRANAVFMFVSDWTMTKGYSRRESRGHSRFQGVCLVT